MQLFDTITILRMKRKLLFDLRLRAPVIHSLQQVDSHNSNR